MDRIKAIVARVRAFYDPTREPLRRRVYTALSLIVTASVAVGLVTGTAAVTVTGILSSVLVGAVAEQIRQVVTPVAAPCLPIDDVPGAHAADREASVS